MAVSSTSPAVKQAIRWLTITALVAGSGTACSYSNGPECEEAIAEYGDELTALADEIATRDSRVSVPHCDTTNGPPASVGIDFKFDSRVGDDEVSEVRSRLLEAGWTSAGPADEFSELFVGHQDFTALVSPILRAVSVSVQSPEPRQ
ncbi:hypothetical protein GCM10009809_16310 [Isoptericola hypogeus]|uniref:Lipoprotein n=1 Tax=Isoptericola hypogeus TaxID=300179 RepID=A0ABN2JBT7_9MICO